MIHSAYLDSFFLTEEQLENSPSRQDGIDRDTEINLRAYGCELIQEAGILLGYNQVVMATGQVLFHRFYCKRSMKNFNVKKVAATALWEGAKLEEVAEVSNHPRELLEKVMVTIDRCTVRREMPEASKLPVLEPASKEYEEFRRSLIRYEVEMLKAFGFITNVEHPHKLLLNYIQVLSIPFAVDELLQDERSDPDHPLHRFMQYAWNVANDSLRTTLCVRFNSSAVACGIIFYTARKLQVPLPEDWWELFEVQLQDVCEVCRALYELYLAPKPRFIPVCHQLLPSKPPTPALGGGSKGAAAAGATPMIGATPELGVRPGGRPLDPSVRRTMVASESTPNLAAAAGAAAANGAAGPSPPLGAAPGSARKRSRSRSPLPSPAEGRKRLQLDGSQQQPGQLPPKGQSKDSPSALQQQARAAMAAAAAGRADGGAAGRDGSRERARERDRERERGGSRHGGDSRRRSRSRSRSWERRRSRSRSRDRRRSRSRDGRRHRSRDRRRHRSRSRSRDRDRRPRSGRDGDGDRGKGQRADSRGGDRGGRDASRAHDPDKQQQQQKEQPGLKLPPPPADGGGASSPRPQAGPSGAGSPAAAKQQAGGGFPPPPDVGDSQQPPGASSQADAHGNGNDSHAASQAGSGEAQPPGQQQQQQLKAKPVAVRKRPAALSSPDQQPGAPGRDTRAAS